MNTILQLQVYRDPDNRNIEVPKPPPGLETCLVFAGDQAYFDSTCLMQWIGESWHIVERSQRSFQTFTRRCLERTAASS